MIAGGPLGDTPVGISGANIGEFGGPDIDYVANGDFSVLPFVEAADVVVDVNFDGESGTVPSGFREFNISFTQDGMDLGSFDITDEDGFQEINAFVLALASASEVFFTITGEAFNDGVTLPDFQIRLSEVPIPGALPLLISGFAGLAFASRKKRAAA